MDKGEKMKGGRRALDFLGNLEGKSRGKEEAIFFYSTMGGRGRGRGGRTPSAARRGRIYLALKYL